MKVETSFPISALSGSVKNSQVTFATIQGEIIARARVVPANPNSSEQQLTRGYITVATKNWDNLTSAQREAWENYARTYFAADGRPRTSPGLTAYVRANTMRQLLGLPLTTDAPVEAPPAPVQGIAQVDATNPDTVGVIIYHTFPSTTGLVVAVRMTPATHTVARRPQPADLRYVKGATAASTLALPASGGAVQFYPARYHIQDGQRYGVEVRVVRTADGIASPPVMGDFIKVV